MENIFLKLYAWDTKQAWNDIVTQYNTKGYATVYYMYFANLVRQGIVGYKPLNREYLFSLSTCDFLLPDGIALKLYLQKWYGKTVHNLNGTDFILYVLSQLENTQTEYILYGWTKEVVKKAKDFLEKKGGNVVFFQDGYSPFDTKHFSLFTPWKYHIFFVCLGTPKQELFIERIQEHLCHYRVLAFAQGGTFDFWAWKEKRAPLILRKWKCEWLWRVLLYPKKNAIKVYYSLFLAYFLFCKKENIK